MLRPNILFSVASPSLVKFPPVLPFRRASVTLKEFPQSPIISNGANRTAHAVVATRCRVGRYAAKNTAATCEKRAVLCGIFARSALINQALRRIATPRCLQKGRNQVPVETKLDIVLFGGRSWAALLGGNHQRHNEFFVEGKEVFDALAVVLEWLRTVAEVHGAVERGMGFDEHGRHC